MNGTAFVLAIIAIVFTSITVWKYMGMKQVERDRDPELDETLAHIERLEERIRVLERIVTENKIDLRQEIDNLE